MLGMHAQKEQGRGHADQQGEDVVGVAGEVVAGRLVAARAHGHLAPRRPPLGELRVAGLEDAEERLVAAREALGESEVALGQETLRPVRRGRNAHLEAASLDGT